METIDRKRVYTEIKIGQKVYNYTLAAIGVPYREYACNEDITATDSYREYEDLWTAVTTAAATPGTLVSFPAPISGEEISFNTMTTNTDNISEETGLPFVPPLSIRKYTRVIGSQVMSVELIEQPWRSKPIR